ncbi:hypothetical protein BIT28_25055 [Photobacterium proteolyticum]|uniref:Lipoprotein n=1 Tax=Photobacterium proteolyticum TaxID=1903952 RepID=A0A1Q9GD35_9GAMM|nr:hypothetical protein [Photobacterium proteolyticum]OLQ72284.1 hypothetical protein BIT28_25055 [Photobacterium proteolyticum]
MKSIALLVFVLVTVSGCSSIRGLTTPDDDNLLSGAGSIIHATNDDGSNSKNFESIDLDELLKEYGLDNPTSVASAYKNRLGVDYTYLRNDLQERIISASNQRCAAYIRTITSSKSQSQTAWTSLSLLLSGAASVITHSPTSQAFAAGSTVSTGILSSYNEAYFNNLTLNVVSAGISKKRESILAHISSNKSLSLNEYSVNAAISDAINYHAACNIISGMETAAKVTQDAKVDEISTNVRFP